MSVLLNTSTGDLVIDLYTDECPLAAANFLKLCKLKYYNNCLFYNVQQNFICQTGDPTGTGTGGTSAEGIIKGPKARFFKDELARSKKIDKVGLVGMAHTGGKEDSNASQFFITLRGEDMDQLEGSHTIFGELAEGLDVLETINALYCDQDSRPYQDVRIRHTYILDDPFPDPAGLVEPPSSPVVLFPEVEKVKRRLAYEESLEDSSATGMTEEELDKSIRKKEAQSRAIVLEMTGDLPDAEVKPPEEVLFVCKLNSVTTDEDLELIFSRFGTIKSCEVIRDFKTGDSLNYAFIEFESIESCVEAYEKMNNALIDDRRIKVDFSQSVSKLWNRFLLRPRSEQPNADGSKRPTPNASTTIGAATGLVARGMNQHRFATNRTADGGGGGGNNTQGQHRQSRFGPRGERREEYRDETRPSHVDNRKDSMKSSSDAILDSGMIESKHDGASSIKQEGRSYLSNNNSRSSSSSSSSDRVKDRHYNDRDSGSDRNRDRLYNDRAHGSDRNRDRHYNDRDSGSDRNRDRHYNDRAHGSDRDRDRHYNDRGHGSDRNRDRHYNEWDRRRSRSRSHSRSRRHRDDRSAEHGRDRSAEHDRKRLKHSKHSHRSSASSEDRY